MRVITLEEHFTSPEIVAENSMFNLPPQSQPGELTDFYKSHTEFGAELLDIEKIRLPYMDSQSITMQVLSYTSPVSDKVPPHEAIRLCARANDILAGHVAEHPDRFAAFATLPMSDPKAAANELERCVKELKFCGTLVAGQYQGHFYDEPQFLPIFAKAEELDVPVYFHPALINPAIQDYYFMSSSWSVVVGGQFASAGFGWHMDVGIHVVRMILSGIFDKLPGLKIISGHWGEMVPAFLERMDYMFRPESTGLRRTISDYYKENIYITPSGILSAMQLEYLVKLMGAEHILYSVDYPYMQPNNVYTFIADANLTQEQKELIAHVNAERILHVAMILVMSAVSLASEMTDYEAVNNLIVSERLYRVSHRNEELAKCYAPDAKIHTSWQSGGVSSFVGHSAPEAQGQAFNVNRCGGALIYLKGTKAFVEYPSTTTRTVTVNGVEAVLTSYMRLLYRVEKRQEGWKIVGMFSLNEADELAPVIPGQDLKINPDDVKGLRVSCRWLAYSRRAAGAEFDDDLPGTDRPEDVKKVYDEAFAWLDE